MNSDEFLDNNLPLILTNLWWHESAIRLETSQIRHNFINSSIFIPASSEPYCDEFVTICKSAICAETSQSRHIIVTIFNFPSMHSQMILWRICDEFVTICKSAICEETSQSRHKIVRFSYSIYALFLLEMHCSKTSQNRHKIVTIGNFAPFWRICDELVTF